jgi:hypothetical protein
MSSIQVTLTAAEVWIIRDLLTSERARLAIKEREIFGEKFNEHQLQIIESNRSLISSALTKIFNAKGDAKHLANAGLL